MFESLPKKERAAFAALKDTKDAEKEAAKKRVRDLTTDGQLLPTSYPMVTKTARTTYLR